MRNSILLSLLFAASLLCRGTYAVAQVVAADTMHSKAIPWRYIDTRNVLWRKTVYRDINIADPCNKVFWVDGQVPRDHIFVNILLDGALAGRYPVFKGVDKELTQPLSRADVLSMVMHRPGDNAFPFYSDIYPSQVVKIRIKEEWLFDRNKGEMVVRIQSIAPVKVFTAPDGNSVTEPIFWFSYPDLRDYLANFEPYGLPKDKVLTWDEYFESRQFLSKIIQVDGPVGDGVTEDRHEETPRKKK